MPGTSAPSIRRSRLARREFESYLRAISSAKQYIYLETQYLTSRTILNALSAALNNPASPNLEIIILCNLDGHLDLPGYAGLQQRHVNAFLSSLSPAVSARIAMFTTWTYQSTPQDATNGPPGFPTVPWITPTYIHSKVAIVDDCWATIGSANLDGASLDVTDYALPTALFGQVREQDVNCVIYSGVDNLPSTPAI